MIRRYLNSDFDEIRSWYKARGFDIKRDLLPKTGFIAPGIAACFLYITDSGVGIIEGLIANPEVSPFKRSKFIDAIIEALVGEARKQNIKYLYAFTQDERVFKRSKNLGFREVGITTMVLKEI